MSTQFDVPPADPDPVAAVSAADSARRLDRLAPLLHELLAWDLVRQTESGAFVIPDEVQQRLSHLTSLQSGSIAQVYVGRKCGRCGSIRVTRMVEGVRLCSTCSSELATPSIVAEPDATTGDRKAHHGRSRWHRKAG
jgi:ribosomal protein L37AE/L43A